MTLSPYDFPIEPRWDLPPFMPPLTCANPRCNRPADHAHHVERRTATGGPADWIEIPGKFLIANKVGICAVDHQRITGDVGGHKAMIAWDPDEQLLCWVDLEERWADPLNPMPPIMMLADTTQISEIEPTQDQGYRFAAPLDEEPPEAPSHPTMPRILEEISHEPRVVESNEFDDAALLAQRVQATDRFLAQVEQGIPSVDEGGEPVLRVALEEAIEEAQEEVALETLGEQGADRRDEAARRGLSPVANYEAVAADERTRELTERAAADTQANPPAPEAGLTWWRGLLAIDPESMETKMLEGDMRVKLLVDEIVEKAKRAPKPRKERIAGEPTEGVPKRNWTLSVPAEERTEEKGRLGEDGHALLEATIKRAAEIMPHREPEGSGWKYYSLMDALNWFVLNYTPEGEDA